FPARVVSCPLPTPAQTIAAATSMIAIASAWVTTRRRSSRNRSSISSANPPNTTTSSGASGAISAKERTGGAGNMAAVIACGSSKLARGEVGRQLGDRRIHQLHQRPGPDADQQGAGGEHAQHDPFAGVDVAQLRDVGVGD